MLNDDANDQPHNSHRTYMALEETNIGLVRAFYAAFERNATADELAAFYHEDAVQEEFPNQFLPSGAVRDRNKLRRAAERGRSVMASQRFELLNLVADGSTVVVEAAWTGMLGIQIGEGLPAGTEMQARFAQFFEIKHGKIYRQRNYDCFFPW